jgi:hypothetical protein
MKERWPLATPVAHGRGGKLLEGGLRRQDDPAGQGYMDRLGQGRERFESGNTLRSVLPRFAALLTVLGPSCRRPSCRPQPRCERPSSY